jgi:hypothetical protein
MQHSFVYEALKDFQPALAAVIALTAAGLAYTGAMAKVRFDRKMADREFTRRKVAVYLRLRYEIRVIANIAGEMRSRASGIYNEIKSSEEEPGGAKALLEGRPFEPFFKTPSIDEAWQNLHFFPLPLANELDRLRRRLILFRHSVETLLRNVALERLESTLNDISKTASELRDELDSLIAVTLKSADIGD